MHSHSSFPKWKYHADKEAVIVHSEAEELALGPDWADSPADFAESSTDSAMREIEEFVHRKLEGSKKSHRKAKP